MGRKSRFSSEVRERAVRMVFEHGGQYDSEADRKYSTPITEIGPSIFSC